MKKQRRIRLLAAALTLALCIAGSLSAAAAPAAVPADKGPRVVNELSGDEKVRRDTRVFVSNFGGLYLCHNARNKRPADPAGAAPAEGAVATMTIYSQTNNADEFVDFTGHAFIAIRNVSDHELDVGGRMIAPGTGVTIGTRANRREHAGIWYNLEGFYCYYLPSFYPDLYSMQVSLDQDALDVVDQNLALSDHWSAAFNCSSFASSLWNAVCSDRLSAGTPNSPKGLRTSIRSYGDKVSYNAPVPYDYIVTYGASQIPSADYE